MPYVEERDIVLLAADLGAGYFTASELYAWHSEMIKVEGREPVSKKAFGMALKEAGLKAVIRRTGEEGKPARCWLITRPWQRRGDELLAQEKREEEDRLRA
jgi:hypothetical protein